MSSKSANKIVLDVLGTRPIAFNPLLSRVAKSVSAGLFMSQLLYWCGKGRKEGWVYKTIDEFEEETTLSREEQDNAIRKWKALNVLQVEVKGVPPKRHFKVDVDVLLYRIESLDMEKSGPICVKHTNQYV